MLILDKKKFESALHAIGTNLSKFANESGISRQSLYNMFSGKSILSTSFEKVLSNLNVNFDDLVTKVSGFDFIIEEAPYKIQKLVLKLKDYADAHDADLFLIGSRAKGKKGIRSDWDFAIYFRSGEKPRRFSLVKQNLLDKAFPYSIDLVCLNDAPSWFLSSVADGNIPITRPVSGSIKLKESI